ncbi:Protein OS-9 [Coemansia spiralis]|nr:Protein OS-9 [Coemansia spiralis]
MRLHWGLCAPLLGAGAVLAAGVEEARVFSPADITDDMHEVPRFRIRMLDELVPASRLGDTVDALKRLARDAEQRQAVDEAADEAGGVPAVGVNASGLVYDPIVANAGNKWRFVCQVPRMSSIRRAMAAEMASKAEVGEQDAHAEEQAAIARGLELLQPLQNTCLSYKSGWWMFEYCHDRSVRQYHRPAPDKKGRVAEIEYFLGEYSHLHRIAATPQPTGSTAADSALDPTRTTQIRKVGRRHYLVQLWGGGTMCDVTGEPRDVEVQYHCDPSGHERISLVEEIAICQYVVIINTPRLCVDAGFYDTAASTVFNITCQHVVPDSDYDALMARSRLIHSRPSDYADTAINDDDDDGSDDDDNVPLARLGRGLDGKPAAELGDDAAANTAGGRGKNKKLPQLVVGISDPALIEATRRRKEVLRRLLEFAYGDMDIAVKFSEAPPPNDDETPPADDVDHATQGAANAREEL